MALKKRYFEPHAFMFPSYLVLFGFMGYPLINCIRLAFTNYKITRLSDVSFAGLNNFKDIFADPDLWMILGNSVKFVFFTVLLQFVLGLILALALKKPFRFRGVYQAIVFLPWAFSGFIIGLTFQWLFNGEYGPINDLLMKAHIITTKISFLGTPGLSLFTVIVALVWAGIPFFAIMILAALQSIPEEMYEAAKIDGASVIAQFREITIPYIKPTIVISILLRTIWVFNNADLIYIMTKGGPANTSNSLSSYMFMKAYSTLNFGLASALGVLFMFILVFYVLIFFKITKFNQAGDDR